MRYKVNITVDDIGVKTFTMTTLDGKRSMPLSRAFFLFANSDLTHPLGSYKSRGWTKLKDGQELEIPEVDSKITFRGDHVRTGDVFIHYNTHHIIHGSIGIQNGEFMFFGKYVGAKTCRRGIVRSLKRLLHAAQTRGHKLVRVNEQEYGDFVNLARSHKIDWWSQGEDKDRQWRDSITYLVPVINELYKKQLNWRANAKPDIS